MTPIKEKQHDVIYFYAINTICCWSLTKSFWKFFVKFFAQIWSFIDIIFHSWYFLQVNKMLTILIHKVWILEQSFQKDEPLYNIFVHKWGQICCKSVQVVRGSSFRNDLLQNPYFRTKIDNQKSFQKLIHSKRYPKPIVHNILNSIVCTFLS